LLAPFLVVIAPNTTASDTSSSANAALHAEGPSGPASGCGSYQAPTLDDLPIRPSPKLEGC